MGNTIKEEFTIVQRVSDRKYNIIDANGKILLEQWYDWVSDFYGEVAVIIRDDGDCNFINKQGKILSEQWFEWADDFSDGLARVKRGDGKYNLITENGKFLSEQWYDWIGDFDNRLARVQRCDKKCNYINKNGKIISDEWFNRVFDFKDGFAEVQRTNGEWAKIDKTGKLIKDEEMEVEVYNRNFPTWIDGSPLITTIERNDKYLKIERVNHYGKLHSMQRDGDKTTYYIHGIEVSKTMWKEYIRSWKKIW